jgi:GTP cyclohydrolase IA
MAGTHEPPGRRPEHAGAVDRDAAAQAVDAFLRALGRDPVREPELVGTGQRVAAAYADELLSGYAVDVDELISSSVFAGTSELVAVRDIAVATMCPHHLMPSTGVATVAFAPEEHLLGVGTVVGLVEAFARRLSLQEQLGERVVAALQKHLAPRWVACRITLTHACMTARGERAHGARVETLALAGGEVDEATVYAAVGLAR